MQQFRLLISLIVDTQALMAAIVLGNDGMLPQEWMTTTQRKSERASGRLSQLGPASLGNLAAQKGVAFSLRAALQVTQSTDTAVLLALRMKA